MSLYNAMFGVNPMAGLLLATLGLHVGNIPRFRDVFLTTNEEDKPQIVIYTRTGGGNREFYDNNNAEYPDGPTNESLRKIEGYVRDEDDSFDSTYALFYYNFREDLHKPFMAIALALEVDNRFPMERFKELMERLKSGEGVPDRAAEVGRRLITEIEGMLKK